MPALLLYHNPCDVGLFMMLMGGVMGTILPSQLLHMTTVATTAAATGSGVTAAATVGMGVGRGCRHYGTLAGKQSVCLCVRV